MFLTLLSSTSLTPPPVLTGGGVPTWWLGVGGDPGRRPIPARRVLPAMRAAVAKPAPAPKPKAAPEPTPAPDAPLVLAGLFPALAPALGQPVALYRAPAAAPYDETDDLVLLLAA